MKELDGDNYDDFFHNSEEDLLNAVILYLFSNGKAINFAEVVRVLKKIVDNGGEFEQYDNIPEEDPSKMFWKFYIGTGKIYSL